MRVFSTNAHRDIRQASDAPDEDLLDAGLNRLKNPKVNGRGLSRIFDAKTKKYVNPRKMSREQLEQVQPVSEEDAITLDEVKKRKTDAPGGGVSLTDPFADNADTTPRHQSPLQRATSAL